MPHISPNNGPQPDQSSTQGPFEPLQTEISRVRFMLDLVFEDTEDMVPELMEDVLSLPPEERFTESTDLLKRRIQDEFGDLEIAQAALPNMNQDRLADLMINIMSELVDSTLENVWRSRDSEIPIVLSSGYNIIRAGFERDRNGADLTKKEKKQFMSSMMAFFARVTQLSNSDDIGDGRKSLIQDVGYTLHYIEDAVYEKSDFPNPDDLPFEKLRSLVLENGAVLAYVNLEISVGRGAELAEVSRFEFEEVLEKYGIEPRYGPSSVSELREDGVGIIND